MPDPGRHILLLRDPRDVVVSHFHHIMRKNRGEVSVLGRPCVLPKDYDLSEFIHSDFFGIRHVVAYIEYWTDALPDRLIYYLSVVR